MPGKIAETVVSAVIADVLVAFADASRATGASFWDSPGASDELLRRAESILEETTVLLGVAAPRAGGVGRAVDDVGRRRAEQAVSPADSLNAATLLFDVALPYLLGSEVTGHLTPEVARQGVVARTLHQAIMRRVLPSAVSYVDVLLDRVETAHTAERTRVSADLHDRTAHGIAAALQNLELLRLETPQGAAAARRLDSAVGALRDTLDGVRDLAGSLRDRVGARSLDAALATFAADCEPSSIAVHLEFAGDLTVLTSFVKEESFLIVREALRNALTHGRDTTRVDVRVAVAGAHLEARVSDDGGGFDADALRPTAMGMAAMSQRAEALAGVIDVVRTDVGTDVLVRVPLRP